MPFLEFFDETLDINSTDNYYLSVSLSPEELSFCLLDSIRNKYVLIRSFEPDESKYFNAAMIEDLIRKDDFLGRKFKMTGIMMPCAKSTLVPAPLYDAAKKDDYYALNYLKEENEVILSDKIADPDAFVLFAFHETFTQLLNNAFPGIPPFHHTTPLFRHISGERKKRTDHYIHVHVERDYFNLVIFDHSSLLLCNTFMYRNPSDILYYVLNAFRKMDIKNEVTVHLSGLTSKYDELSSGLLEYIRNVSYAVPAGSFTFSYVFNDLDLHRYLNLLTLVNCE